MTRGEVQILRTVGIQLQGDFLISDAHKGAKRVSVSGTIVEDFHDIRTPAQVQAVARRYGFLMPIMRRQTLGGAHCEPVSTWLEMAKHVQDILEVATALNAGRAPDRKALESLAVGKCKRSMTAARFELASAVSDLLWSAELRPMLAWSHERKAWSLSLASLGLNQAPSDSGCLGALAYFTALRVMEAEQVYRCSIPECQAEFSSDRMLNATRHHYCPKHRGSAEQWKFLKRLQRMEGKPKVR